MLGAGALGDEGLHKGVVRVKEEVALFAELALARRLERAEGDANAKFVEARARLFPESGAAWIEVAGAYAMFDGVSSPCTQTFGLGIFETATTDALDEIETFFRDRGAPVSHETCPLAGIELAALLSERGYTPIEFTSVMYRPAGAGANAAWTLNERIRVHAIEPVERDVWAQTMTKGWGEEYPELKESLSELGQISTERQDSLCFLAQIDGQPIASAGLTIHGGVALFAGACTILEARRQGAQLALLDARLRYAAGIGCDVAMMCAAPGSASQRNAERHGFRIAYTRTKWQLLQEGA
jgi:hypothetical protein